MLLIFDNYDSFTFNLCDYFKQLGQELIVIRNDERSLEEIEKLKFSGIVISPGPGIPETSGILMQLIERWHQRVPILGICLGHQALGVYFGAKLVKTTYPMHGKVSNNKTISHPMWDGLPENFDVCRYHSLALELIREDTNLGASVRVLTNRNDGASVRVPTNRNDTLILEDTNQGIGPVGVSTNRNENPILITATSEDDNIIMAIAHKHLPIWGIQFHPEAILTQYGIQILNNWLKAFILHK